MSAYVIAIVREVFDRKGLEAYWANVAPTFEGTGARTLSAYAPFKTLEGGGSANAAVTIEFPSMAAAVGWYESPAYQTVRKLREGAANIELIVVDGVVTPREQRLPGVK